MPTTQPDETSRFTIAKLGGAHATDQELLTTLFALGREVTSVLNLDELLQRIPELIARLIDYTAFAVYLLDEKHQDVRMAYSVGYPEHARAYRMQLGEGAVGTAVKEGTSQLIDDVRTDPRYVDLVPGTRSKLVVPLRRKGRIIGALNLLSDRLGQFTPRDEAILRQFGAHVAVALENARLFESERKEAETLETLVEIARDFAAILDLELLLRRLAQLVKRVIDYRTFGMFLLKEDPTGRTPGELELKVAVQYGEARALGRVEVGSGLVGYAALHREAVLVEDVSKDPRYIEVVADVRSELAVPLLLKDRLIGVFDLESPELAAFNKRDAEILTLLASQAAVAIENARLYETLRANEERIVREITFAQRVQMALLPADAPKRLKGLDVAARFAPATELGGDFYDLLMPDANTLVVAVADVSGKGVPAALYGAFAGELVRSRTFRRRFTPVRSSPAGVLASMNTILHERRLEEYYCTLCYASIDQKRRVMTISNSGLPYPVRCTSEGCGLLELPGLPLGSFAGSTYEELTFDLREGDVWVFCTDGILEARDRQGREFGSGELIQLVSQHRHEPAQRIVDVIFNAVNDFRGSARTVDDMTVVALRVTA
ncbi:MAG TPA: GAF domain-containing protein [Vicinamibacterales bacterium]|jgi:sigma-B regulation protein RsbU (phosphoserine phosphatase)